MTDDDDDDEMSIFRAKIVVIIIIVIMHVHASLCLRKNRKYNCREVSQKRGEIQGEASRQDEHAYTIRVYRVCI